MLCYYPHCNNTEGLVRVEAVWFDGGEGTPVGADTRTWENKPHLCEVHRQSHAHWLATLILRMFLERGIITTAKLPTRWFVEYADASVMGGDMQPQERKS